MNKEEKIFIYKKFEKINMEIFRIKCLARVLEELLIGDNENLTRSDISTLSVILARTACALSKQSQKLEVELGRRLLL